MSGRHFLPWRRDRKRGGWRHGQILRRADRRKPDRGHRVAAGQGAFVEGLPRKRGKVRPGTVRRTNDRRRDGGDELRRYPNRSSPRRLERKPACTPYRSSPMERPVAEPRTSWPCRKIYSRWGTGSAFAANGDPTRCNPPPVWVRAQEPASIFFGAGLRHNRSWTWTPWCPSFDPTLSMFTAVVPGWLSSAAPRRSSPVQRSTRSAAITSFARAS